MSSSPTKEVIGRELKREDSAPPVTLSEVFKDMVGNPIRFFLHKSIRSDWRRRKLIEAIEAGGGAVQPNDTDVSTVLVDELYCNKDSIQIAYNGHSDSGKRNIWVESLSFVQRCIGEGVVRHNKPTPKGMGGLERPYNRDKISFTPDDDDNLARWLAIRIPDGASGGRRGEGVYRELEMAFDADPEEYAWVKRHTWSSWRNRFNKRPDYFIPRIQHFVDTLKPTYKQAYGLQRKRRIQEIIDISASEKEESGGEEGGSTEMRAKRRRISVSPGPAENGAPASIGKGKGRAIEDEVDDERRQQSPWPGDLEIPTEPGPSQKAPIVTYSSRNRPSRQAHDTSHRSIDIRDFQTSQATLVEPSQKLPSLGKAISPNSQDVHRQAAEFEVIRRQSPEALNASDAALYPPAFPSGVKMPVKSAQPNLLKASRPKPVKMARRPRTQASMARVQLDEPPYRNTRARSRSTSVEPSAVPPKARTRRKTGNIMEEPRPPLPQVEESVNENDENDAAISETLQTDGPSARHAETLGDEQVVEALLVNNLSTHSSNEVQVVTGEGLVGGDSNEVDPQTDSMDFDDAQTDQLLRQPRALATAHTSPANLDHIPPDEMLDKWFSKSSRISSVRLVPSRSQGGRWKGPRHSMPLLTRDLPNTPTQKGQGAPGGSLLSRRQSITSEDSFPIVGTKASAVKKHRETEEKHTPYAPPVGTRAAASVEKQPLRRARKATKTRA